MKHLYEKNLRNAIVLLENVREKYGPGDVQPETRYYEHEEREAVEALVKLRELELQQFILSEKVKMAIHNHSNAFRAYLKEKEKFESR